MRLNTLKILIPACLIFAFCSGPGSSTKQVEDENSGSYLYKKYCILCHGADGKLAFNGAKEIPSSVLNLEERKALIKYGKNLMTPFEGILTDEQIDSVTVYTFTLK